MIKITAFRMVPPFAQGLVRDLRVRWALEEAGLPYDTELVGPEETASAGYRARQPFGQVPVLVEDDLVLFESGAIVLHLGARSEALLPADAAGRARATTWVLAALNTIEVAVQQLAEIDLFHADEAWVAERRPQAEELALERLQQLATWLGDRAHLEGRFTAGDLMMATVLRILRHTDLVARFPTLASYLARCEARPAFQRALRAQLAVFEAQAAAGAAQA
jgi:glutathione S-transferase